jgi:hypothetical protein
MTRERVRWSACPGIISGAISLVLFAAFNVRDSRSSKHAAGSNQFGVSEQHAGPSRHISKLYDLIDVGQRVLSAQADLALSPEERADVLQKQLEIYAEAEDNLQKQIKEGKAENADLDHLRYERLGVEIDLEVLRRCMAE